MTEEMGLNPPPAGAPQPKSNRNLIIGIVAGAVLVCCCCLVIGGWAAWMYGDQLIELWNSM